MGGHGGDRVIRSCQPSVLGSHDRAGCVSTGEDRQLVVSTVTGVKAADDRQLIGHASEATEGTAKPDARDTGLHVTGATANIFRGIHLRIPHLVLRGATLEKEEDDRLVLDVLAFPGECLAVQKIGERETTGTEGTYLQETSPGQGSRGALGIKNRQHWGLLLLS